MDDWRPIESAPKDGRFIALRFAHGGETWGDWDNGWCLENWSIPSNQEPIAWAELPPNLPESFYARRPGEDLFPPQRHSPERRLPPL